jgi:hypothetical protein
VWRQSFAAALFAGIPLFLLAGIYKKTEQTLTAVRRMDVESGFEHPDSHTAAEPAPENNDALNAAIACLRPWLANQGMLRCPSDFRG